MDRPAALRSTRTFTSTDHIHEFKQITELALDRCFFDPQTKQISHISTVKRIAFVIEGMDIWRN